MSTIQDNSRPDVLIHQDAFDYVYGDQNYYLDDKDAIIYALSLGFSVDPVDRKELKYTYEGRKDFTVFPTFCSTIARCISIAGVFENKAFPLPKNPLSLMAEYYTHWHLPTLPSKTHYVSKKKCIDIIDKKKFVFTAFQVDAYNKQTNDHYFTTCIKTALPGVKGDGFQGTGFFPVLPNKPSRKEDKIIGSNIAKNQPLLYRLNGYTNAIHADPDVAIKNNFERPIMHGLATVEICIKQIIMQLWDGQDQLLKMTHARLFGAIYPGQQLQIKVWQEQDMYIFDAQAKIRQVPACYGVVQKRKLGNL